MTFQHDTIRHTGDIDLRVVGGHIVKIGAVAELLGLLKQIYFAGVGHHCFKGEGLPGMQKFLADKVHKHTGEVGVGQA